MRPPTHDIRSMPRRRSAVKAPRSSDGWFITTSEIHGRVRSASRIASAPRGTVIRITRSAGVLNISP